MTAPRLADIELNGLVDGRIEAARRADLLRRLAASPPDRARVETWQAQADLIRESFREVAAEPLPAALDLAPPRLRSVDVDRLHKDEAPIRQARHGGGAAIAAALLITIGLTLSWMAGSRDDGGAPVAAAPADADQGDTKRAAVLPTFRVPDLAGYGLRLTSVSADTDAPATLVLRYRDGGSGRIALEVARNAPDVGPMPLEHAGKSLTWRSQTAAFTLGGSVTPERLRAVATALQAAQGPE